MDRRLRDYERQARSGNIEAARKWLIEAGRAKNDAAAYEAMSLIFDMKYPELKTQLAQIEGIQEILDHFQH